MEHCRRQVPSHPLSQGKLAHRSVDKFTESKDLIQHPQVPVIKPILNLVDPFEQVEGLAQTQVPVELAALPEYNAQVPNHPPAVLLRRNAVNQNLSRSGLQNTGEHLHRGTFSRAVGADVSHNIPFFHLKGNIIHSPYILYVLHKQIFHRSVQSPLFFDLLVFLYQMADFYNIHENFSSMS